jgi:hypothetical protein
MCPVLVRRRAAAFSEDDVKKYMASPRRLGTRSTFSRISALTPPLLHKRHSEKNDANDEWDGRNL